MHHLSGHLVQYVLSEALTHLKAFFITRTVLFWLKKAMKSIKHSDHLTNGEYSGI